MLVCIEERHPTYGADFAPTAKLLLRSGAPWTLLQIESLQNHPTIKFNIGYSKGSPVYKHICRCLEAVNGWADQRDYGEEFVKVPREIFRSSVEDIRAFFKSLRKQRDSTGEDGTSMPRYRKKICVVGPSSWGKPV